MGLFVAACGGVAPAIIFDLAGENVTSLDTRHPILDPPPELASYSVSRYFLVTLNHKMNLDSLNYKYCQQA